MYFLNFAQGRFAALDHIAPEATRMVKGPPNFIAQAFKRNGRFGSKPIRQDLVFKESKRAWPKASAFRRKWGGPRKGRPMNETLQHMSS